MKAAEYLTSNSFVENDHEPELRTSKKNVEVVSAVLHVVSNRAR